MDICFLMTGDERWTTATYCIDECALIKGLSPDHKFRFRVSALNKFGISPYSWASTEVRTRTKGKSLYMGPHQAQNQNQGSVRPYIWVFTKLRTRTKGQ